MRVNWRRGSDADTGDSTVTQYFRVIAVHRIKNSLSREPSALQPFASRAMNWSTASVCLGCTRRSESRPAPNRKARHNGGQAWAAAAATVTAPVTVLLSANTSYNVLVHNRYLAAIVAVTPSWGALRVSRAQACPGSESGHCQWHPAGPLPLHNGIIIILILPFTTRWLGLRGDSAWDFCRPGCRSRPCRTGPVLRWKCLSGASGRPPWLALALRQAAASDPGGIM